MKYIGFTSLAALLLYISCVPNKKLIYLQNLEGNEVIYEDSLITYSTSEYKLQYNDVVDIQVHTMDEAMNEFLIFGLL